ncbi:ABC-type oligopeptide transport system ATPase subunit [Dysgonomonas sp. PFB1-18]|uniref:hypothetical protein n=1 Tax=unclassified Dysgonomonas TaxID=2630389 RepID=UPI00247485E6|nr:MULTISPECIES: hypothetical protein [unclassified Dysgonomonas]MDH6308078.1 ABC-type oligopeptide transport system ATPase subunit [Dysgonomonas sp. PF1-14]MDH6339617.1 ABC-type oligopeptide transport system ATPase subunit [Dysgonomonas sp. PF1-16]MDH6381268.1 ABC-type oligopeptide transport system ATPase subunit [Dysgonomonas sp. PFB1-18]MDH6398480.1 ABC-type oligopeptide transport system ATPase subunit [Dysgonomonas sp. PF1-23]
MGATARSNFFADKANMESQVLSLVEDFAKKHGVSVVFTADIAVEQECICEVGKPDRVIANIVTKKSYKVNIE